MRAHVSRQLLKAFSSAIGLQSASLELKWMQEALASRGHTSTGPSLHDMVRRRVAGEPLQYILGSQPFGPLDLAVRPPTLIPRPETEDWVTRLAALFTPSPANPMTMLDLGTGTACIPILLSHLWTPGSVGGTAVDISVEALDLARENAGHHGISLEAHEPSSSEQVPHRNSLALLSGDILQGQIYADIRRQKGQFDLITSNPPYISSTEYKRLPPSVKDHEDVRALLGDPQGVSGNGVMFYEAIVENITKHALLKESGLLVFEVGHRQGEYVRELLVQRARMRRTEVWKDPWGKQRVVLGWS